MKVKIKKGLAGGKVIPPPSKSYAHRLMICSALATGKTELSGIIKSDDMIATENCIGALGAKIFPSAQKDSIIIEGMGKPGTQSITDKENKDTPEKRIFECNESGSTLRFFIPIALISGEVCEFHAKPRLISRGIDVYDKIFAEQNIEKIKTEESIILKGKLKSGVFNVRGDISSQFISGLMFALPCLDGDSEINITTKTESKEYIDITADCLEKFGIVIEKRENSYYIKGNQSYISPGYEDVERDMSNAAFLEALNMISGGVKVECDCKKSLQPDRVYIDLFKKLKDGYADIDISQCPDLAPILFALSAIYNGAHFTGTRRLKIKESDRAQAMSEELAKFGIEADVSENEVTVKKGEIKAPDKILNSHGDHRIVMALSVIATLVGAEIDGAENVKKSYPDFFRVISSLGIEVEYEV